MPHHAPQEQNFFGHMNCPSKHSNIHNTNALPAQEGYIPIAYAPQESISVLNTLFITLHALKTNFQHLTEFSLSKDEQRGPNVGQYLRNYQELV